MPKSAIIVNDYSFRNAGDAAIMLSTTKLLRKLKFERTLPSTKYTEDAEAYKEHRTEVVPALFELSPRGIRNSYLPLGIFAAQTFTDDYHRQELSGNGRKLTQEQYSMPVVGSQLLTVYEKGHVAV